MTAGHDMALVRRVYGPPGTGKTTTLSRGIGGEVEQHGPTGVLVGSFSVTAAEVLAGRNTALPKSQIGTLHKHAYGAIGHAPVALDAKVVADWNETERPEWFIHADGRRQGPPVEQDNDDDDAPVNTVGTDVANARTGDQLITALDLLRSTMTPPEQWPPNVIEFAERWEAWKRSIGGEAGQAVDYSDMILHALARARDGEPAPGSPRALVFDEAQDMTPAEVALVLRWGRNGAERVVFGLDDDQAIMSWRGGHPETLIGLGTDPERTADHDLWVDPERLADTVLDQSFRIPASAHRVAEQWVRKLSIRREKAYRSRQVDPERFGAHDDAMGTAQVVRESLTDAGLVDRIEAHTGAGRRVMVLASCNYQLSELISELRRRGVPFHNPYRPAEPRWNPLGKTAGVSTPQRLFRYLVMDDRELGERSRLWTGEDVAAWIELLDTKTAGLAHGAKTVAKRLGAGTLEPDQVAELFAGGEHSEAFAAAVQPDLAWFERSMLASKAAAAPVRYSLSVVRNAGVAALVDEPMVTVGTTHSAKGGEADVVMVAPDISRAAARQLTRPGGKDSVIRLFYVAMTRCLGHLEVLSPSSSYYVKLRDLLPSALEVTA